MNPRHAAPTLYAKCLAILRLALACRATSGLLPVVDRNASVTASVPYVRLASTRSAGTLVLESAVKMLIVTLLVTPQIACASRVTWAIRLAAATCSRVRDDLVAICVLELKRENKPCHNSRI